MKNIFFCLALLLSTTPLLAQNIDFIEADPAPEFGQSRNGFISHGDVDNDGDSDLIISGMNADFSLATTMYLNDGSGNFTEVLDTPFIPVQFGESVLEDIDNDGDLDFFITGSNLLPQSFSKLYMNDGEGNFTLNDATPFQPTSEGAFAFADVDADGDKDLLLTGFLDADDQTGFSKLYLNNGGGDFVEVMDTPFVEVKSSAVAFIDCDNDSDLDILISGSDDNSDLQTNLYRNNGSGDFTLDQSTMIDGFEMGDFGIGDVDNDGNDDILLIGYGDIGSITQLYLNDGTGAFSIVPSTPFIPAFLGTVDLVDFDNDGDLDALMTGAIGGNTFMANIYENQGLTNFVLSNELEPVYLSSTAVVDLEADNDLDLVILSIAGGDFMTRTYINLQPIVSVESIQANSSLSIFPNPSTGNFRVKSTNLLVSRNLLVYNAFGKLVYSTSLNGSQELEITLNQRAGVYYLQLISASSTETVQLVIN